MTEEIIYVLSEYYFIDRIVIDETKTSGLFDTQWDNLSLNAEMFSDNVVSLDPIPEITSEHSIGMCFEEKIIFKEDQKEMDVWLDYL